MPVKRALLLAAFLVATPVCAEISEEVKATCMDAKDFVGCVQALSGGVEIKSSDGLDPLRDSMKKVAARLQSGTSLRDSTITFQPVVDELAVVKDEYPDSLAVKAARVAVDLFDVLQASWQGRISTLTSGNSLDITLYSCHPTKKGIARFNEVAGREVVVFKIKGGLFGTSLGCLESVGLRHERAMMSFVTGVLSEGSVNPKVIDKYEADRAEKYRLANLSAWEKHLDANPGVKAWAVANPSMALKEQAKFNAKNPQQQIQIPAYSETLRYLSKLNPPL